MKEKSSLSELDYPERPANHPRSDGDVHRRPRSALRGCGSRCHAIALLMAPVCLAVAILAASGCGYTIGNSYQANITSVYIPIFTTEDFRRGPEFQLTEAVQKQVQARTHFRLARNDTADTKLTGVIKSIRKNMLGTTAFDDPRELQIQYAVDVTWEDLRTGKILAQQHVPIEPEVVHLFSTADFAPEVGQSLATATQDAIDKMARQIVDMMQAPW